MTSKQSTHNKTSFLPVDASHHLLVPTGNRDRVDYRRFRSFSILLSLTFTALCFGILRRSSTPWTEWFEAWKPTARGLEPFYSSVKIHVKSDLCPGFYGDRAGISHSGYIGLKDDTDTDPRRSFFWYFEAQTDPEDAPVILTIGGGPGTSGMLNPLIGQSHCRITENGTEPNPNSWTEHYNLLALDHPIGVGFSYGRIVNNSRAAAFDAYDFLQKFYTLYPHLLKNPLVLAGGSYGGTYIPHIATVIHEQNTALASGGRTNLWLPGAQHLNLESMMVSNPYSDTLSHFRWALQQRCYYTDLFNATQCHKFYEALPACLEAIQLAYEVRTPAHTRQVHTLCDATMEGMLDNGRAYENVNWRCNGTFEQCVPESVWSAAFLGLELTKTMLGVPRHVNFTIINTNVTDAFVAEGDLVQQAYLLYPPLLAEGIRLLHYIGKLDANCGWPGILSFLKLMRSPFQESFTTAPDVPWGAEDATVRVIGPDAGNMTYVLMGSAGHMVTKDQPVLVKKILEHWVDNRPWF